MLTKVDMGQQESSSQNNNATTNPNVGILKQGDITFSIDQRRMHRSKGC